MADRQLCDPKAGPLRLEVQLGVEQGRAGHQGRRGLEHLAAHQLETAIDILEPDPIQQPDQHIEDAGDDQPVFGVGPPLPPARRQIGGRHPRRQQFQIRRIELTIPVHEGDVVRACGPQPVGYGASISQLAVVLDHPQPGGHGAHRARDLDAVVRAAIVDQDDVPIGGQFGKGSDAAGEDASEVLGLVVDRDDQAERSVEDHRRRRRRHASP